MWKPSSRIRHETQPGAWPDRRAAKNAHLFSPLHVGNLDLSTRTWVPAMVPWRATHDGEVTDDVVDWYERFARGKPGAIVVEATGIRDIASGPLLRIGHDRYIEGLTRIVEAVHAASEGQTKIFIQLIDFLSMRRRPTKATYFSRFLTITDVHKSAVGHTDEDVIREALAAMEDAELESILNTREFDEYQRGYRERVTDMHLPQIENLPQILPELFADAAGRAQQAGFDGIELHYAHAYTMASFLSKLNTRDDGYGGGREGRARLPLEVYEAVRERVGPDYVVGCRMLSDECIEGGSDLADAQYFASRFAEAGMDFLSFSRGGKFEDAAIPAKGQAMYPYTGQSGYECMPHFISDERGPYGRNIEPTAQIKEKLQRAGYETPVIVAGGLHGFTQAEDILRKGQADIIGMARQILADPDWFLKVRTGQGAEVRTCKYTNYCEGLDQKHKIVTCQLWDRLDMDADNVAKTPDGKRRLTAPPWAPE
ncbi:MAG TPA: NADH:flavin oxidoreductase [Hellea balneolensis]|uniref:NADH:flavin oxidoreductase n=1 Tax=Hellea balneolensis TaxID=287478 RepID=A0A7C3C5C3_9PROT|nr:NADH:flavin oxidoreductase [Hellea balneolensis]